MKSNLLCRLSSNEVTVETAFQHLRDDISEIFFSQSAKKVFQKVRKSMRTPEGKEMMSWGLYLLFSEKEKKTHFLEETLSENSLHRGQDYLKGKRKFRIGTMKTEEVLRNAEVPKFDQTWLLLTRGLMPHIRRTTSERRRSWLLLLCKNI